MYIYIYERWGKKAKKLPGANQFGTFFALSLSFYKQLYSTFVYTIHLHEEKPGFSVWGDTGFFV